MFGGNTILLKALSWKLYLNLLHISEIKLLSCLLAHNNCSSKQNITKIFKKEDLKAYRN